MKDKKRTLLNGSKQALWMVLGAAVCLSTGFSTEAQGRSFGVGYYSGPTSGPTLSYSLSAKNTLKVIAPLSFNNVVADYQFQVKRFAKGKFRFNVYFGVGADLLLSGADAKVNKKKEDNNANARENDKVAGSFAASLRVPLGLTMSMTRYPIDIFAEIAPQLMIYDGVDFGFDQAKIDWKRIGFGARYYF